MDEMQVKETLFKHNKHITSKVYLFFKHKFTIYLSLLLPKSYCNQKLDILEEDIVITVIGNVTFEAITVDKLYK